MQKIEQFGRRVARWLAAHRRGATATVVAALSGFSAVAFGIAPRAPDAADLPQLWVTEKIELSSLDEQLEALAIHPMSLVRGDVTRDSDTGEGLLARLGAVDPSAAFFLRSDPIARMVLRGRSGKLVQARTGSDGQLDELVARYPSERREFATSHFVRLTISRVNGAWHARTELAPLSSRVQLASGTIRSTLFAATEEAGVPDAIASQLADIFSTDIDFHSELRRGDTFSVAYEALTADGEPVPWNEGAGRVLAAEFVNAGRAHHALWFDSSSGRGGYFDAQGVSKRRTFLASPMEFSRITSGFALRFHPILKSWRRHLGVDYAAPVGTPVRAIGEGVVDFAGWQNGYGQVVQIQHGKDRSTLYAHLSRIDVRKGQRVTQGDHVGAVGMTGWTTGPHLHFEFRVDGQHLDPLVMAKAAETVAMDESARPRFEEFARTYQAKLEIAESMASTRASFE